MMQEEKFKEADELKKQISKLNKRRELWRKEVKEPYDLAYNAYYSSSHPAQPTRFPDAAMRELPEEIFRNFRDAIISHYDEEIAELRLKFARL